MNINGVLVCADLHLHQWSILSPLDEKTGLRERCLNTLKELEKLIKQSISENKALVICGDVFHIRGSINSTVYNAFTKLLNKYAGDRLKLYILAGNHDTELNDAVAERTALDSLDRIAGVHIVTEGHKSFEFDRRVLHLFAYRKDLNALLALMAKENPKDDSKHYAFIHAPIYGANEKVLGLDIDALEKCGYEYIFAGDIHIHRSLNFLDTIYSVGSFVNHSWKDIGKDSGYIDMTFGHEIDKLEFHETDSPKFLGLELRTFDLEGIDTFPKYVDGHIIKFITTDWTEDQVESLKKEINKYCKPKYFVIENKITVSRRITTTSSGSASIEDNIKSFIAALELDVNIKDKVQQKVLNLMNEE